MLLLPIFIFEFLFEYISCCEFKWGQTFTTTENLKEKSSKMKELSGAVSDSVCAMKVSRISWAQTFCYAPQTQTCTVGDVITKPTSEPPNSAIKCYSVLTKLKDVALNKPTFQSSHYGIC